MTDLPTSTFSDADATPPAPARRGMVGQAWRRLRRSPIALICLAVIAIYVAGAAVASVALDDWQASGDVAAANQAPSAEYWLGTDAFGRSVLAKTLLGAKVSLTVALTSCLIAIPVGVVLGAVAGYYGGWIDDLIIWLLSTIAAIPGIIRIIALKQAFQDRALFAGTGLELDLAGMPGVCLALALTFWIGTCRLVRAETLKLREMDFVLTARAAGRGRLGVLRHHILPNVMHIGVINFSLCLVAAVTAEVILSYLGLGVAVGTPSWGNMISAARSDLIVGRWWELTAAASAMFLLVLAVHVLGDRLRDALDPRLPA